MNVLETRNIVVYVENFQVWLEYCHVKRGFFLKFDFFSYFILFFVVVAERVGSAVSGI